MPRFLNDHLQPLDSVNMKNVIIGILLLMSFKVSAQKSVDLKNDGYYESLRLDILSMPQSIKADTLYVRKDSHLKDYSGLLEGTLIIMLDSKAIYEKTKKNKPLTMRVVHPFEYDDGTSHIIVSTFGVKRKKSKYQLVNSGFSRIKVEYDCDQNKYIYSIITNH